MVGCCHPLKHESEQTLGDSEGQGSLVCCRPRRHQEPDTNEQLNNSNNKVFEITYLYIVIKIFITYEINSLFLVIANFFPLCSKCHSMHFSSVIFPLESKRVESLTPHLKLKLTGSTPF